MHNHEAQLVKPWNTVMCMFFGQAVHFTNSMKDDMRTTSWVAPACQQC